MEKEQKRKMDFIILLILVIFTTVQTTSLYHDCNSDVYLPASGMAALQHNVTLQYCHIDNCTIIRIDTYWTTTGYHLHYSKSASSHPRQMAKPLWSSLRVNLNCFAPFLTLLIILLLFRFIAIFLAMVSSYIAAVHMIFKKLHSTFGKLIMLYNIVVVLQCANFFATLITHHYIAVHSKIICYLFNSMFMQSVVMGEAFSTCLLAYLAYVMHRSYKSRQLTKRLNKELYKYSMMYSFGKLLLFDIFILSYDFGTGTY